ncbi:DUF3955 domain-containing protein [Bacillus sp. 123MFChir2]|uniref:DUF3955 domain-containing protein n=1 Tax=Bacillus sp. 123MFChir2 TaxID=1169144 RepID=UPI000360C317|nr:DUF3955 domain-containing protein [Bacillus sp. 123MFChir2]
MKKYILAFLPFILGAACFVSFHTTGSTVTSDGKLVEPFYLLPMGYAFIAIGIIGLVVSKMKTVRK